LRELVVGETDPIVWYRVYLYVTDARGQTTTLYRDVRPITATLTLKTNPPSGNVILEGGTYSAPLVVTRVVNINLGIGVPSPQTIGGIGHVFSSWSNGGSRMQIIAVPPTLAVYTATLAPPFRFWMPSLLRSH